MQERNHETQSGTPPSSRPPLRRCAWAETDPLLCAYHDTEWGVPQRDSRLLWEMLMLEGFQAGLSWLTILRKREAFQRAFSGFNPDRVAAYDERDTQRLLADSGIIRSRAKIEATIQGARIFVAHRDTGEDFAKVAWSLAGGQPLLSTGHHAPPAKTVLSETISRALRTQGYKFVGPVIVYAWMQAVGMVNDHTADCFRRAQTSDLSPSHGTPSIR